MAFEDTVNFQISVIWDGPAYDYRFDKPFRVQADRMKVTRFSSTVRSSGSGPDEKTTKFFEYQLTPLLSGMATIEALNIEYVTWPDSLTGIMVTDPVSISIRKPLPPKLSEENVMNSGWWAVIAVGLIGLGFGLYSIFKRKTSVEKVQSAREKFLEELDEVKRESGSDLKKFQTGLYGSLTSYFETKYGLKIDNQTADLIASELDQIEPDQTVNRTLADWLIRAEKEKYAPLTTSPGEVTRLASEIKQFFERMK
ncbi:MAG: hypothetical protein J7J98_09575 [candidate division Zixibacteria bacterium]|nr:hypothetical protein [candidate division Zixibacteria bacterium]